MRKKKNKNNQPAHITETAISGEVMSERESRTSLDAKQQIREQNEFLNTILESLTHPFYIVDVHNYQIVVSNSAAKQLMPPGNFTCYQLTHQQAEPCDGVNHPCPLREVIKTKKPISVEHIHLDKQGNKKNFEIHAYPIFNAEGEVVQIIEYTIDITERRKAEEGLLAQQEQLLQVDKMISLGILVSGVAHEINNPNNSIALNSQFLENAFNEMIPIMDEYYRENKSLEICGIKYRKFREKTPLLFSGILNSSRRIQHIVEGLKSFSRKESIDMNYMVPVDMNSVVQSALDLMGNIIKKSTHRFTVTYADHLPQLMGNFHKLEQVVVNLVQNACHALLSPDNGIFISTAYDPDLRQVTVTVRDEGEGIPAENLKLIMEPFFTTKRTSGGTGLGLSVSSKIIKEHGGTLHFTSTPGQGTRAEIRFPFPATIKDKN